ncbi:L-2-hydroxyglutarate oxidase [Jatrophihabitans sp. DSM 45814]
MTRYLVVGAGILGLATARALLRKDPAAAVTVLEKEAQPALHQTGRNSGVIHSGIYYPPGSAKAVMCRAGARSMTAFAEAHGIPVIATGKLINATQPDELPGLKRLYERGIANQIPVSLIGPEEARGYEPYIASVGAVHVASTAITDYRAVCGAFMIEITAGGGDVRFGHPVIGFDRRGSVTIVRTTGDEFETDVVVNCAGLHADRIAALDDGTNSEGETSRIIPFRGEYFELRPERRYLVKGLIYPVPDPDFPFLGVHLTKMVDGGVHAGPNAVLALAREGYRWQTVRPRDLLDVLSYPGFWRLAQHNMRPGLMEVLRSLSKKRFAASLARLVPEITADDLIPSAAGVRAQALRPDGGLVDDFLIRTKGGNVHVLNAPSPAATSSLEIGQHIASLAMAGNH